MKSSTCSFPGCEELPKARRYCEGHYTQLIRGKPLRPLQRKPWAFLARDEQGCKQCPSCNQWLPEDAFGKESRRADSLTHYCRLCSIERRSTRDTVLRHRYGISEAQYDALLDEQGGVCAACGRQCPSGKRLAVDHDHSCCDRNGSCGWCIRGLLCSPCNSGLGFFGDSPARLMAAAAYLLTFQGVNA